MKIYCAFAHLALLFCVIVTCSAGAQETIADPLTIEEAVEIAVKNNANVNESKEKINSASEQTESVRADRFFKIGASYSYTRLSEEPFQVINTGSGGSVKAQVGDQDQHHWDVTLVQPIFTGFALSTKEHMARLEVQTVKLEKQETVLHVTQEVKTAFLHVLLAKKILLVIDDAISALQSHESDAQLLYESGLIRYNDLLAVKVELADVVQDREEALANRKMALANLNRWLNYDINQETELVDIENIPFVAMDLLALIKEGLRDRPLFQALRLGLETLDDAIILEKSAYYPDVALIGSYQQDGNSLGAASNDFSNDHNASLTIQANWTLFEWNKTTSKVRKVQHDRRALLARIADIEDAVRLQIKDSYLRLTVAQKNIQTANEALTHAEENWRIINLLYKEQVAIATEVLDARTFLTRAETNFYNSLYGYRVALAALERATGRK